AAGPGTRLSRPVNAPRPWSVYHALTDDRLRGFFDHCADPADPRRRAGRLRRGARARWGRAMGARGVRPGHDPVVDERTGSRGDRRTARLARQPEPFLGP